MTGERGFATLQNVVAAGLAMVFFAILANVVVMQYTLGVVTAALDDGARVGTRSSEPVATCLRRIDATLGAVAGRAIEASASDCVVQDGWLVARVSGSLAGWAPLVPSIAFERDARVPLEPVSP